MRAGRVVRRELDLWRTAWQQVETFVDRIDGARDQDEPHRVKLEALLRAANVVERRRALLLGTVALSDAVVESLPTRYHDPADGSTKTASEEAAWSMELRRWRLPGTDEAELAAGNLATTDFDFEADDGGDPPRALDEVVLPRRRDIFERRVDGALEMLRVPSYPGSIVTGDRQPGIKADDGGHDAGSLFSRPRRYKATMDLFEDDEEPLQSWRELCEKRRAGATAGTVLYSGAGGLPAVSMGGLAAEARDILSWLASPVLPDAAVPPRLVTLAAQARSAVASSAADAAALTDAADVCDEEGAKTENLADELRAAAEHVGQPTTLEELASAADALRVDLGSSAARDRLAAAAGALATAAAPPLLFLTPIESGLLAADLDDALGARVAYPDGTVRVLRTLETAFAAGWGAWLRWFALRHSSVLGPVMRRFRLPFVQSLRGLVLGGPTGFPCEGLDVGPNVAVGSDTVVTGQPATLRATLATMRPGQVGIVAGDRPAALVVLALGQRGDRLALLVSPLRVSTESDGPGSPGVLGAGQPVLCDAPGLSTTELRSGEADAGPAGDGLVHETISLWSRLRLVFGAATIDAEAGPGLVPEPGATPLEHLGLFGQVPSLATVLVISGLGDEWWDRSEGEVLPRFARPGEVLLLRGHAVAKGEEPAGLVQAAVEVGRVFRTTGSMLERMRLEGAALLSTEPFDVDELAAAGGPCVPCGPEDDVLVVLLDRTWMRRTLVSDITLGRDFAGFDAPSLAAEQLLPLQVVTHVVAPAPVPVGPTGVDRSLEFQAALGTLKGWLRFADDE